MRKRLGGTRKRCHVRREMDNVTQKSRSTEIGKHVSIDTCFTFLGGEGERGWCRFKQKRLLALPTNVQRGPKTGKGFDFTHLFQCLTRALISIEAGGTWVSKFIGAISLWCLSWLGRGRWVLLLLVYDNDNDDNDNDNQGVRRKRTKYTMGDALWNWKTIAVLHHLWFLFFSRKWILSLNNLQYYWKYKGKQHI